jgi:hypothetical protein
MPCLTTDDGTSLRNVDGEKRRLSLFRDLRARRRLERGVSVTQ